MPSSPLQWILPICLVSVAIILPIVGYFWIRKVLSEETNDDFIQEYSVSSSKHSQLNDKSTVSQGAEKQPPQDLTGLERGSTQSMESDDEIESIILHDSTLSTTVTEGYDVEAPMVKKQPRKHSRCARSGDTNDAYRKKTSRKKQEHTMPVLLSPRSILKDPGSPTQQRTSPRKVYFQNQSAKIKEATKNRQDRKSRRRERRKQIDVHVCTSALCEACRGSGQRSHPEQEVTFVSAQPLEPKMIHKLKNAPRNAKWYELGESFHDLYQKANDHSKEQCRNGCH